MSNANTWLRRLTTSEWSHTSIPAYTSHATIHWRYYVLENPFVQGDVRKVDRLTPRHPIRAVWCPYLSPEAQVTWKT